MAKRAVVKIDEEKCDGCGLCIPDCPEGALRIIDGKARLVSDLFCDGLGACVGSCPQNAITIEEREAQPYDEKKAMRNIIPQGQNVIKAHLLHLKEHGEFEYLNQALAVLEDNEIKIPEELKEGLLKEDKYSSGPPGVTKGSSTVEETVKQKSQLKQWPIQLHLIAPTAPYYQDQDVLLAADCVAYALGDFHSSYLKGKSLAIACPKLDEGQDVYREKIKAFYDDAQINTLTVLIMQVPCCRGLLGLAQEARQRAERNVPIKYAVVSPQGEILQEEWVQ